MGKILCECGYIHSDTCGYDGLLYKYDEIDIENLDGLSVFECLECGNIMIDDPNNKKMMITYKPENRKCNKILHDLKKMKKGHRNDP